MGLGNQTSDVRKKTDKKMSVVLARTSTAVTQFYGMLMQFYKLTASYRYTYIQMKVLTWNNSSKITANIMITNLSFALF